jgi:elongation factor P
LSAKPFADIGADLFSSTFAKGFPIMAKINGNEIRPGTIIDHDGGLWASVKVNHVKPGKGGAFAQVELKNLRDGRKLNERFRSEDKVERVDLEMKDQQFLYETDGRLVFMDNQTYEQIELDAELLGDRRPFLQDGMVVSVQYFGDEPLNVTIPQKVTCRVAETEPVQNGQTASKSYKPAVLDNGVRIMVPPFINIDEVIVVHTELMEYSERA